ncbi:DUF4412 domain-containing protein [Winogradskyella endarachnes]|uniref:DUF4412 domain-containing protein n=1 Tax=Winogradskyella endarachnes TaxID=2681965 RepID=A0A6L6UAG9_9FLAO|nr:DUF4412 domain-containing protein [Winogradskyella endarachnes]MUU79340.1 DUF4412 domain-containing protein [Winogradskyella endarachnes]
MKISNSLKHFLFLICALSIQTAFAQFGKANKVELPDTYDFDYIYKLKMTHKKGAITFDYYLSENESYFGFNSAEMNKGSEDSNIFMVLDSDLEISAMFMEMMGKNVVQKTKLKASDLTSDEDMSNYSFTEIDSKTINGYECEGYVTENDNMKITFYITDDVTVSFNKAFGANVKNMPKGFDTSIMEKYAENGLMMEMIYVDKKKSKNNMTMECIGLEKTDFSIDTTKYGSMLGAFGG